MEPVSFLFGIGLLRPSKSPHLVASVVGVFVILLICDADLYPVWSKFLSSDVRFYSVALPIYVTLVLLQHFSFRDDSRDPDEEAEPQFRFTRAMGIGTAFLGMLLATKVSGQIEFWVAYGAAVVQLITFIAYSTIRLVREESEAHAKIFQISFMMFVFLLSAIWCLSQSPGPKSFRYGLSTVIFAGLWLRYELFWIRRIRQIVEVRFRE